LIQGTAAGFSSGSASVGVIDDETAPLPYQPSPADRATNVVLAPILSWHGAFGEQLVNGGFETGLSYGDVKDARRNNREVVTPGVVCRRSLLAVRGQVSQSHIRPRH